MTDVNLEALQDYDEAPDDTHTFPEEPEEKSTSGIHTSGFRDFCLHHRLLKAVTAAGFEHPSEIQKECLPQVMLGHDILGQAKSGMGKTAVFVLGILQQLELTENSNDVLALVLCHTRELALQISAEFERFAKFTLHAKVLPIYGGILIRDQLKKLNELKPNIVVATPGRLAAFVRTKKVSLSHVKHFVIDEADRVIGDPKFRNDIQEIFKMTPREKQTMMYSATMPEELYKICLMFMQNPVSIRVDDEKKLTLHGLHQYFVKLTDEEKNRKLTSLIDDLQYNQAVIFVNGPHRSKTLGNLLRQLNHPVLQIAGGMRQEERTKVYNEFKEFKARILVATDLFGRGIDIERVNVVINFDMPRDSDGYLHRVGRAGRFGSAGIAISFITSEDDNKVLEEIQSRFEVKISELNQLPEPSSYA